MKHKERCFEEIVYYKFADDELEPEEVRQVTEHLDNCPGCKTFVAAIRTENHALREMFAAGRPTPDLTGRVMNRLSKQRNIHINRRRLAYAATFLLVIFLSVFFLIHRPAKTPPRENRVLVHSARVEGQTAQPHIFESKDPDVKFIWLEKFSEEKREREGNNETVI